MAAHNDQLRRIVQYSLTLSVGALAGMVAAKLQMPLPWMLGPMLVIMVLALLGAPVAAPIILRHIVVPVMGVMLGSRVTPDILSHLAQWAIVLVFLVPVMLCMALVSYGVFRKLGGYGRVTAFFSAMPGGLSDMVIIGGESGGDERRIALAHAVRITVVIGAVGLFFGLVLGVRSSGGSGGYTTLASLSLSEWALLTLCALAGVWLGKRLRLPAYMILGPMLLSAVLHISNVVQSGPPTVFVNAAQIVLGTVVGCRFRGLVFRDVARDMGVGALASLAMLVVAVLGASIAARMVDMPLAQIFLAFSPGGLAEMSILAIALGVDAAFVSVMHMVRITIVIGAAPAVFNRAR